MRKVKQNGIRGKPFSILSGVPQGCPFSPLAFLIIVKGLTRLILESEIAGIPVGNTTYKLFRFADDTQLLLKGYSEIPKVWPLLNQYEHAFGMRGNAQQNVRIQCGLLKHTTVPPYLTAKGVIIDWVKTNEYTKILEVPFSMEGEEAPFWESLYHKIQTKLASWHSNFTLTSTGRAMLANFMIYSRPRYWIQTMVAPGWFHQALESDVRALHWEKDTEFDANSTGTDRNEIGWILNTEIHNKRKRTSESAILTGKTTCRRSAGSESSAT